MVVLVVCFVELFVLVDYVLGLVIVLVVIEVGGFMLLFVLYLVGGIVWNYCILVWVL